MLAAGVAGLLAAPARGESPARETIEGLKELAAPASHVEVRFDLGVLSTLRSDVSGAELRVEIATRPDFWYGLGVSTVGTAAMSATASPPAQGDVTSTSSSNSYTLSARLFKRIGPVVLSAGVVDNHGGAGLELRGLEDHLRLEVIGTTGSPMGGGATAHLRVGGSVQWYFVYAQAGLLDAVGGPLASAYVGGGLRWSDPDLLGTLWWLRH
ncbi:MAG TPA: hypothetical protein VHO67_07765 [Polyangia bacterium]|nr:hypothetical protein [Polyangia bacterium]